MQRIILKPIYIFHLQKKTPFGSYVLATLKEVQHGGVSNVPQPNRCFFLTTSKNSRIIMSEKKHDGKKNGGTKKNLWRYVLLGNSHNFQPLKATSKPIEPSKPPFPTVLLERSRGELYEGTRRATCKSLIPIDIGEEIVLLVRECCLKCGFYSVLSQKPGEVT